MPIVYAMIVSRRVLWLKKDKKKSHGGVLHVFIDPAASDCQPTSFICLCALLLHDIVSQTSSYGNICGLIIDFSLLFFFHSWCEGFFCDNFSKPLFVAVQDASSLPAIALV